MQRWTSRLAAATTAMVLAIGSVGCSDDDASRLATQIFGNLLGSGEYSTLSATVDQDVIGVLIDTTACQPSAVVESCEVSITPAGMGSLVASNGEIVSSTTSSTLYDGPIQVTISDCVDPVKAFSNLFRCVTAENAGQISVRIGANGTCAPGSECDVEPEVCVTSAGADDFCGETPPTTTVSTSSSTTTSNTEPPTTSTTSTSTTSTTTLPQQTTRCDITFSVTSSPPGGVLGALSFDTVYPPDSNFDGADAAVNCMPLAGGVLASFNNQEGNNTLLTGIIGIPGLSAPGDVSQCVYLSASGVPTAADFAITVTDANTGTSDVTATTTVEITAIACDDTPVTTTTAPSTSSSSSSTSTSSTLTTTTTNGGSLAQYDVFFAIAEAATYGALQWQTNYAAAPGTFIGSGDQVDCALVPAAQTLNAFNDIEAESNLNVGIIALFGFTTTAGEEIVRCGFEGASMPVAGDFAITVQDSSDTGGQPLAATITIGSIVAR